MRNIYWFPILLFYAACANDSPAPSANQEPPSALVRAVESAQQLETFRSRETISFDVQLTWRGQTTFEANVLQRTDGTRIRVRKQDGAELIFDGKNSWIAPAGREYPRARFDLFTWHYFFCMPWKLSDPGTHWQDLPDRVFEGIRCRSSRLSFAPGTGDAPDDWYLVFSDTENGLLLGAVYIVTYGGKEIKEAEKEPHAIVYGDFRDIDGVPVAHTWTFYNWHTDSLDKREKLGGAVISNVRFADEQEPDFAVQAWAEKI